MPINPETFFSYIPGTYLKRKEVKYTNVSELSEALPDSVCFYENPKFLEELKKTQAGLVFVPTDFDPDLLPETNLFKCDKPYLYYMVLINNWLIVENNARPVVIASTAVIPASAVIGKNVSIGDHVVIEENVVIGNNSRIEAGCVIKENCTIGNDCHFYPRVTIYDDCRIGNDVILHSGVVIGADGFGYLYHENKQNKIPQVGNVIIEDEVEIGANSCVDRATLGSTIVGKGSKIDNLVQIGHNCKLGQHSIFCAQVGLAGSTTVGNVVYMGGQVGAAGHITIGDGVMVGAQSGVASDTKPNEKLFGSPAVSAMLQKRISACLKELPEMTRYYHKIMKEKNQ